MNFFQYVKDKCYFFILYVSIMLFVTLMVVLSANINHALSNVVYINGVCFTMMTIYIVIGYVYRRPFYLELNDLASSDHGEVLTAMPEPQNHEQRVYLELLKKTHDEHFHRLQELYQDKRDHQDFITSWIHEIKVPIAAGRLLMESGQAKTADFLADKFEDELDKIDYYVEQALYYARIDSFSKDYFITEVSLDEMVKKSVKKYAKSFIHKQIRVQIGDIKQSVHTDSKWLGFIIDQIVSNSLKYTDKDGEISFDFGENRKEKWLSIQDTGAGIKPEDINRIFEKGFTGSIGRSHAKSTGIGLYLAKQMALKLGHDLSVQSEEGTYTEVVIHFPKIRNYYHI